MPLLRFIPRPDTLPAPPAVGRIVLIDLAFAAGDDFPNNTRDFLRAIGDQLALWIDHHDHPAWRDYAADPRFVLVSKQRARACPELITEALVCRAGQVDEVWAHADFDGCIAAAKFLRGGSSPYTDADEDARFADAPGRGFVCSERGKRYLMALDQHAHMGGGDQLLHDLCALLVSGAAESPPLRGQIDALSEALRARRARFAALLASAERVHLDLLAIPVGKMSAPDKRFILRALEERARVALIYGDDWSTVATFDDDALDLSTLPGLRGQRGYAFGKVPPERFVPELLRRLDALAPKAAPPKPR